MSLRKHNCCIALFLSNDPRSQAWWELWYGLLLCTCLWYHCSACHNVLGMYNLRILEIRFAILMTFWRARILEGYQGMKPSSMSLSWGAIFFVSYVHLLTLTIISGGTTIWFQSSSCCAFVPMSHMLQSLSLDVCLMISLAVVVNWCLDVSVSLTEVETPKFFFPYLLSHETQVWITQLLLKCRVVLCTLQQCSSRRQSTEFDYMCCGQWRTHTGTQE